MENGLFKLRHWALPGVILGTAALYLVLIYLPGQRQLKRLQADLEAKQMPLDTAGAVLASISTAREELGKTERFIFAWRSRNPSATGLGAMLAKLHDYAQIASVSIVRLDPQPMQTLETMKKGTISLTCAGEYRAIHRFLYEIENSNEQVWIESVALRKAGDSGGVVAEVVLVNFADNRKVSY